MSWEKDFEDFMGYMATHPEEFPEEHALMNSLFDGSGRSSRTRSNGESAVRFFSESMGEDGLYLLDEPENSLSPNTQLKLIAFLEEQVRFYGCQLIIATHSPFILSMKGAKIYNIDSDQPTPCKWTELENVRAYFELFEKHRDKFIGAEE